MGSLTEEEFQSVAALLKASEPTSPKIVNTYVKADSSGYRALLRPDHAKNVSISKDVREFRFEQPCYLTRIDFLSEDNAAITSSLSLKAIKLDGTKFDLKPRNVSFPNPDGTATAGACYDVLAVVMCIEAKSTRKIRALKAKRVRLLGYTFGQLEEIAGKLKAASGIFMNLDAYVAARKEGVQAALSEKEVIESAIVTLGGEIAELEGERDALASEVDLTRKSNDSEQARYAQIDRAIQDANSRLEIANNNEVTLRENVNSLNRDIAGKRNELERLLNDRSLISDEYRDYVSEGKAQSRAYQWFLYFSIAALLVCAWQLYSGAQKILNDEIRTTNELAALLLQRLPFAAALSLIVTVSWKLASLFVSRIMTIHSQRLALARLLVIAKDTVYSSLAGLDVSDDVKFRERVRLKLMMLRSHLTSELGRDFEYESEDAARQEDGKNVGQVESDEEDES